MSQYIQTADASNAVTFEQLDRARLARLDTTRSLGGDARELLHHLHENITTSRQVVQQTVAGIISDVRRSIHSPLVYNYKSSLYTALI
jgi:hypothetical protein